MSSRPDAHRIHITRFSRAEYRRPNPEVAPTRRQMPRPKSWRLPPVVARLGRREALLDETRRLLHHPLDAPRLEVGALPSREPEFAPEARCLQPAKDVIDI